MGNGTNQEDLARGNYGASYGKGRYGQVYSVQPNVGGPFGTNSNYKMRDLSDGTTNTIVFSELKYRAFRRKGDNQDLPTLDTREQLSTG